MQKLFIDKWRWRIALFVGANFIGAAISSSLAGPFAFAMGLFIAIRIFKLKPVEGFKKIKASLFIKKFVTLKSIKKLLIFL